MTNTEQEKFVSEEQAMEVAESAREQDWENTSFLREVFLGKFNMDRIYPFPEFKHSNKEEFEAFYQKMKTFLEEVDSDKIDREGKISKESRDELAEMGAFGLKIPKEYGGLGFTQSEYNKVMELLGSTDSNLTALLSAHQSIGVPQPLMKFGTEEQKKKYLPKIAKGAVTAFALTEKHAGSDPAKLTTTVKETDDGKHYILNGEKLWCTNGTIADYLVVMAIHEDDHKMSAFIVETEWEGVEVVTRCHFMGLKALENGVIRFTDVKVPKENLLWGRGKGLKLALITLNTGRLALPAAVAGGAKSCVEISRKWAGKRVQWGKPVGKHEAIAHMIADMSANTFAMDAVAKLATGQAEKGMDIRLEAAMAKFYNTNGAWHAVDDTLQIRGGRGYETADSLRNRGEDAIPVERMMRDARINLIFEGSNEILRLFIAREAVDKHLQVAGAMIDSKVGFLGKIAALPKIAWFYARWYPSLYLGWGRWPRFSEFGRLAKHVRFCERSTRKLARQIFHGMMIHQAKLQNKQAFLFRIVDIGAELYAMLASCSYAKKLQKEGNKDGMELADVYCKGAKRRIKGLFKDLWSNEDVQKYSLARKVLDSEYSWLEEGSLSIARLEWDRPEILKEQEGKTAVDPTEAKGEEKSEDTSDAKGEENSEGTSDSKEGEKKETVS